MSSWSACRWTFRNRRRGGEWDDLLLDARFVAVLGVVETLTVAGFVRRKHAALNAAGETLDSILELGSQERRRVELHVFVRLAFQLKEPTERLLDVVEREPQSGRDPKTH